MNSKPALNAGPVVRSDRSVPEIGSKLFRFILAGAVLVGLMAYALSYAALYELARAHHFAGPFTWQAIAWPFTVDVASLLMFLLGLDQARRGASARLAHLISAAAASLMVCGNILSVVQPPGAWGFAITIAMQSWPPIVALAVGLTLIRTRRANTLLLGVTATEEAPILPPSRNGASRKSSRKTLSRNQSSPKALMSQNPTGRPTAHQPPPNIDEVIAGMMAREISVTVSNLAQELGVGRATAGRYLQQQRAVAQSETRS